MENNSDKELRSKLQGVEFPFDPKAWEQMENMLDKERKPKGFLWWWFGGVAACLLIAAGMYGYHQFTGRANTALAANNAPSVKSERLKKSEVSPTAPILPGSTSPAKAGENKPEGTVVNGAINHSFVRNARSSPAPLAANAPPFAKAKSHAKGDKRAATNKGASEKSLKQTSSSSSSSVFAAANGDKGNAAGSYNSGLNSVASNSISEILAQPVNGQTKSEWFEAITLTTMKPDALTANRENMDELMKKQEGDEINLKKLHRKIFNYSLGLAANVTGTTLGAQTGTKGIDVFYHTPSYMAGFTHEFMFFKRFAISNSIQFSQTSYKVYEARTSYPTGLDYYTSKITELAVPIGLKAYAVSKPKFRFYIGAGVIAHIKLKETFAYAYHHYNNSPTGADSAGGPLPQQTYFPGGHQTAPMATYNTNTATTLGGYGTNTYDFAINHGRRCYASFYASAGADYIVQKHIVFFTEPLFYMNLEKVGIQDKYKYNLGLSGGIRYQF